MLLREEMFLGLCVTKEVAEKLSLVDPSFLHFFIQPGGEYLEEKVYEGKTYIGKKVSSIENLAHLDLAENNIYSLLRKMIPDLPCEKGSLWLFSTLTDTP